MSRPSNFFFNVTGDEAERLLIQYGDEGDFLARRSESQPNGYTLSILREGAVTHVKVNNTNGCMDLYGGEVFASLPDLVQHYMENPDQLQLKGGGTIIMKRPVSIPLDEPAGAEARVPAAQRWFHSNITGDDAKKILEKEKLWSFLVRESQRTPGSYAITVKTEKYNSKEKTQSNTQSNTLSNKDSKDSSKEFEIVHILISRNPKTGMFSVGGGDEFANMAELLGHYRTSPMVEERNHKVVYLSHMVTSTCVPADAIDERIKLLSEVNNVTRKTGFDEEFDFVQQADEELFTKREGKRDFNITKNRYKNIVPYDHTRVILTEPADPVDRYDTDYINANYITVPEGLPTQKSMYISTQGCMDNTVVDFWRMVWQVNCRVIVMTTRVFERGKPKCFQYWPDLRKEQNHRGYYVKTVDQEAIKDPDGYDMFIRRRFMVSRKGAPQREIFHLQFVGWPDHGCPNCPETVLNFLDVADETYLKAPATQGPMVVHCSAGIGRTGTFIVIDILLSVIRNRGPAAAIDIPQTVKQIRDQRSGMVQTEDQYEFVYRAVSTFVRKIHRRSLSDEGDQPLHLPPPPVPRRHKSGSTETE